MANYDGKSPLRMHCPLCGSVGTHPVSRTDPSTYRVLVGDAKILYRRRTKYCRKCEKRFITVEVAESSFDTVVAAANQVDRMRSDVVEQNERLSALQRAVDGASRLLSKHPSLPI
jgi:transcriptional regulator NrdR family protein